MPSLLSLLTAAVGLTSTHLASANQDHDQQVPLVSDDYVCEHPPYKTFIVSRSPLVIYLENFITPSERAHLLNLGESTFTRSGVTSHSNKTTTNSLRTSHSTTLPPSDPVVSCIESRALAFQGHSVPRSHLEPLQLVKYAATEHYHFHTDWFTSPEHTNPSLGGNRLSSFFVYVRVEEGTTGDGTNFPRLDAPAPLTPGESENEGAGGTEWWCEEGIVDCDEPWERGLTFRPVEGNAVFWANLDEEGRGDERVLHAGLPVVTGGKVGMNIWTREGPLGEGVRG